MEDKVILTTPISEGLFKGKKNENFTFSVNSQEMVVCTSYQQAAPRSHLAKVDNSPVEWHKKLRHISAERLYEVAKIFPTKPNFDIQTINDLVCTDWSIIEAKRVTVHRSNQWITRSLKLIHMEVLDPVRTKSIGGRSYALEIMNDFKAYSDIFFLSKRSQVF